MTTKELLNQNIPESAVEQRDGGGGKKLSYLTGQYVINRLNEVLGQGSWSYGIIKLDKVFEGEIEQYSGKAFSTSYIAQVQFNANIDGKPVSFIEVGYGDGTDKKSPGKAHELATKEAVTDGLKRAAKNLGISMGLGLYFKSGEYVDETSQTKSEARETTAKATAQKSGGSGEKAGVSKSTATAVPTGTTNLPSASATPLTDTKALRAKIRAAFGVLEAQKKITKQTFVTDYLGGGKVDTISEEQVVKTIEKLKTNFKELSL